MDFIFPCRARGCMCVYAREKRKREMNAEDITKKEQTSIMTRILRVVFMKSAGTTLRKSYSHRRSRTTIALKSYRTDGA